MLFDVVTLFPEIFQAITQFGVTQRAIERGAFELNCINPRDFTHNNYRTIDDRPYGGGPGMVMLAKPLSDAIQVAQANQAQKLPAGHKAPVILLSPQGQQLTHAKVMALTNNPGLILICGRYEGIDQRLLDTLIDEEISIGDFVLTGGEIPAMALIDAVVRQLPGVLNDADSAIQDSFVDGLLDCAHYTRPEVIDGLAVPAPLMSGDHKAILKWRRQSALTNTQKKRPDLLVQARKDGLLSIEDENFLKSLPQE